MTPTAVGLVLVEGHGADGEIMDQDAFDVPTRRGTTAISTSDYVAGTMSRTRAMAHGRRPHAIGVTWSDESEIEASQLLKSLTDAGFDNVVPVRSPEAGEALARGIGRTVGYRQTAVCLLEPESVVVSMVDTYDDVVETVGHREDDTSRGLISWLSSVFDINDWDPGCLILVGPDADLTTLAQRLEQALGIPVFAPPEAELALARGAALASTQGPEYAAGPSGTGRRADRPAWSMSYSAALTMLVAGVLALVVSVSLVAGLKLTSSTSPGTARQPATRPVAPPVAAPPPARAPLPIAPPPAQAAPVPPPQPTAIPTVEAPPTPAEEVSAGEQQQAPTPEAAPPPASDPQPPSDQPPAAVPPPVAPPSVPSAKPPLLTRILSHIPGLHQDAPPPANTPDGAPPTDAPPPPPPG